MMSRREVERVRVLEARLLRYERMIRRLARMHGLTFEQVEAEESPGVRNSMPSTHLEFVTWCRLHGLDEQVAE